jgi:hypothetical protein
VIYTLRNSNFQRQYIIPNLVSSSLDNECSVIRLSTHHFKQVLSRSNTTVVSLASKCFGQAKLDQGITLAYSIKIALRIVGMHGGDPTSATTTTCGARLCLCWSNAESIFKLPARTSKRSSHEITRFVPPRLPCMIFLLLWIRHATKYSNSNWKIYGYAYITANVHLLAFKDILQFYKKKRAVYQDPDFTVCFIFIIFCEVMCVFIVTS